MSFEYTQIRSRNADSGEGETIPGRGIFRAALMVVGAITLVALLIPGLVIGSAVAMLAFLWPLFLGAYREFGYVPGTSTREAMSLAPEWWLLTFLWIAFVFALPLSVIGSRRKWSVRRAFGNARAHRPRPRV